MKYRSLVHHSQTVSYHKNTLMLLQADTVSLMTRLRTGHGAVGFIVDGGDTLLRAT